MSARRRIGTRETVKLLSAKRPPGHKLLSAFLRELDSCKIPETPTTLALAAAFERILFADNDALTVLQLKRPRSRPRQSSGERANRKSLKVLRFLNECIEKDPKKTGAPTRAVKRATKEFGYKDERSVWRIWEDRESVTEIKFEATVSQAAALLLDQSVALAAAAEGLDIAADRRHAEAMEIFKRQQPVIDAYAAKLSPKKRAAFLELDGQECYRIAAAAARKSLTTK